MRAKSFLSMSCALAALAAAVAQGCGSGSPAGSTASDSGPGSAVDGTTDQSSPQESGPAETGPADSGIADAATADAFVPAAHRAFPQVPNTAHKTMSAPTLVTIVASNDAPTDGTDTAASLQAFSDVMPDSPVWTTVSGEYQLGALSAVAHLTGPPIVAGSYTTDQLRTYVTGVIAADAGPAPNGNTIYLLYMPNGAGFAGTTDCGYHAAYPSLATSSGDQIAVAGRCIPYADQETQLGQLTRLATHEIFESATDPLDQGYNLGEATATPWDASVWQGWVADKGHVELGDLCEGTRTFEPLDGGPNGGWEFQRIWSNMAAAAGGDPCVPPYGEPYYSLSAPQDWYGVQAGGTVTIPLVGWSAEATPEWLLHPTLTVTATTSSFGGVLDGGVAITSEAGVGTVGNCFVRYALNNGTGASIQVTAPASAQSGDYVVLSIHSFREKPPPSCYPPVSEDEYHFWPVGIYVP
jgi:hypothetical protein